MKYLREIFDTHYPYTKIRQSPNENVYRFQTDHDDYEIGIGKKERAHVAFDNSRGEFSNISGIEGRHAHKVFGTIKHIIHQHVKEHPEIKSINFSAKKNSRIKLYNKLSKDYSKSTNYDSKEYNIPVR